MQIFSTPREVPFLHYTRNVDNSITLRADTMPLETPEPFGDWFETVDVSHLNKTTGVPIPRFAANILANRVACKTRRAAGNILFVQNKIMKYWFENTPGPSFTYVVDKTLAINELRCTYWKTLSNSETGEIAAVDGGVQFSPAGFSRVPNWKSYFARCFL